MKATVWLSLSFPPSPLVDDYGRASLSVCGCGGGGGVIDVVVGVVVVVVKSVVIGVTLNIIYFCSGTSTTIKVMDISIIFSAVSLLIYIITNSGRYC